MKKKYPMPKVTKDNIHKLPSEMLVERYGVQFKIQVSELSKPTTHIINIIQPILEARQVVLFDALFALTSNNSFTSLNHGKAFKKHQAILKEAGLIKQLLQLCHSFNK